MYNRDYFLKLLSSFLRFALAAVGTWFVKNGIGTEGEWTFLVAGIAMFIINIVSIFYAKYKDRLYFLAALNARVGTSEDTVKENAADLANS